MISKEVARELLRKWKARLGLDDWRISLKVNCDTSDTRDNAGLVEWTECNKCATIWIISEEIYGEDRVISFDFERILVHELLHIKFVILDTTKSSSNIFYRTMHQLIDDLSRALVCSERHTLQIEVDREVEDYAKTSDCPQ